MILLFTFYTKLFKLSCPFLPCMETACLCVAQHLSCFCTDMGFSAGGLTNTYNVEIWVWDWRQGSSLAADFTCIRSYTAEGEGVGHHPQPPALIILSMLFLFWCAQRICSAQCSVEQRGKGKREGRNDEGGLSFLWLILNWQGLLWCAWSLGPSSHLAPQYPSFSLRGQDCSGWNFSKGMREWFMEFSTFFNIGKINDFG